MTSSRSTASAKDVFANLRWECSHCGKKLKVITVELFGAATEVPCWGSCGCEESKWDGLDVSRDDRKIVEAGVPVKYLARDVDVTPYQSDVYDGMSLYVHGPNGTGKSTFAAHLAKCLVNMGRSVMFATSKRLTEEVKATFNGDQSYLDRLSGVEVLVIDDLGKEHPTPYALSMLYMVFEDRYGAMKPTVVTSNYSRDQLAARWAEVDQSTAEAIVSRLCDSTVAVEMGGRDRRLS